MNYLSNYSSAGLARGKRLALTMLLLAAVPSAVSAQTTNGQAPRPFWIFGHNPNELSNVDDTVASGANALEPDIMLFPNSACTIPILGDTSPSNLYVYHDPSCPTRKPATIEAYLDKVHTVVKNGGNVALIALDIKTQAAQPELVKKLHDAVAVHLNNGSDGVLVNILYSVGTLSDANGGAFSQISSILGENEGVQIDGENDPEQVYSTLPGSRKGFGNGSFGITLGAAPNVLPSIMWASWLRASTHKSGFTIPYAFPIPVGTTASIGLLWYDLIINGVDGLIADEDEQPQIWSHTRTNMANLFTQIKNAAPGSTLADIYVATAADNPFRIRNQAYGLRINTNSASGDHLDPGTNANLTFKLTGTCGSAHVTVNSNYLKLFKHDDVNYVTIHSPNLGRLTELRLDSTGSDSWWPTIIRVSSVAFGIPVTDDRQVTFDGKKVDSNQAQIMTLGNWGYGCIPPSATPTDSPSANAAGWNNSDVTVNWNWLDKSDAGLDYTGTSCPTSSTSSGEGSLTVSATCTDNVGNYFAANQQVKVDKTKPVVNCGAADGVWHASDISIACTGSDALSGLSVSADASFNLSTSVPLLTETNNAFTSQRQVFDAAGNSLTAGPVGGNKIDKKPPVITINQPAGTTYTHSSTLTLSYTVTDGGSGVAIVSPTMNGSPTISGLGLSSGQAISLLTSLPLGPNTFAIQSTDNVANHSSKSVIFTIIVSPQSMIEDVNQFVASGAVSSSAPSLLAILTQALAMRTAGQCGPAANQYAAFIDQVNAQTGKTITPAAAAILIADAQYLIAHCP